MEALSNKEIDLARVILNAAEAKILGVQEHGLSTFLKSNIRNIKPALSQSKIDEQSIILPYIQRTQRSHINANYFGIEAGAANPFAGTTNNGIAYPASAWDLTLNLGNSWLKTDLKAIERYFLPGNTLIVLTWDNETDKNAKTLVFTIVNAINADSGSVSKAIVTVEPNVSAGTWAGLGGGQAAYQVTFGVAQTGVNSISDRESWCHNQPADLSRKIIVNWLQTVRYSRCVDEAYKKTLDQIMSGKINAFMQGFQWSSLADQNKRMAMLEENAFMNTVFYGQRLNDLQQVETYQNLPAIGDPLDPNCTLEYKASALGFFTILTDCQRVVDLNGAPLDLDYIFQQLYYLKRYREADGDKIAVIDSLTDRWTASKIDDAMAKYYKARKGWETTRYAKIGEKITHDNMILFNYNLYDIPDVGIQWAVFHDTFFDDHVSAFNVSVNGQDFRSRGRMLWFLDFSDMALGIAGTKSVTRKDPDPDTRSEYKCVITPNVKEYNLRSTKFTAMLDRPHRHLIIYNFSDACPTIAGPLGCDVPNS